MSFERVHRSKSQSPQSSSSTSQFAPRSFPVQEPKPKRPPTQEDLENEAFQQNKFDAFGLQLKEKSGTITPVEQERLGVLQAKMDSFWAQRMERAKAQPNLLEILIRNSQATQTTESQAPVQANTIQTKSDTTGDRPDSSVEQQPDKTGLPDALKAGVERLSGYSLDNVRVHYNSPKPPQIQALAYTQGTDIHVAPGQEKHLPHETWHIIQQMQGRVNPTMQMKGVHINDDEGLEQEADRMGIKALQMNQSNQDMIDVTCQRSSSGRQEIEMISPSLSTASTNVLQRAISLEDEDRSLSATEAFELIRGEVIQFAVPPNALLQVLTRFDFNNRSFTGKKELALEVERLLKEEYSLPLPTISSEMEIRAAAPDDFVILGRGCNSVEQLNNILKNSSAGGGVPNSSVAAPSEESAISDVAFEGVPWKVSGARQAARRQVPRIEFTTNVGVLMSFANRGGSIVVKIQKKYLAKGSGSEGGWISDVSAPVAVLWVSK